jgi:antirestriction protein
MSETRIDTRDLALRLEELEAQQAEHEECLELALSGNAFVEPLDDDEQTELAELYSLRDEVSGFDDGVTLIAEDDFENYARELADDIGVVTDDNAWPLYCIDWEWAARELAHDYSVVTYNGEHWFYRV